MRRLIVEEPVSRAAIWSRQLAWFALAVTLVAVMFVRFEVVDYTSGFAALAAGLALAALAVLLSLAAFVRIWTEGRRGLGPALGGLAVALVILGWPGFYLARGLMLPAINDVTTDIEEPPAFSRSRAALEARGGRVPPEPPRETRLAQREAYPQIASLTLDVSADEAFNLVLKAAAQRRWQVIESIRPGGRMGLGRVEAVDRTFLLRLPDDVTVRLRPIADGTRIDVRSASRFGRHDLGQNARRIRAFLDTLSDLALGLK